MRLPWLQEALHLYAVAVRVAGEEVVDSEAVVGFGGAFGLGTSVLQVSVDTVDIVAEQRNDHAGVRFGGVGVFAKTDVGVIADLENKTRALVAGE
ncbi:MAG: hypothetical protein U5L04_12315 [Trueperaceae bacterium]|nr:hypothetical protein [Trueperaceae bacterium]